MKKQIFILVVAVFATLTSFGQALPGSLPIPVACDNDALHPIAGKAYTYKMGTNQAGGNYLWWATRDSTFLSTSALGVTTNNSATQLTTPSAITEKSANYGTANVADSVRITWSDSLLNLTKYKVNPTFVAMYYSGGTACTDNFKVYELDPIVAFTVDIKNIVDGTKAILDYGKDTAQCVDIVRGAKYLNGAMQYNYGTDTLFYEVVAANFTKSWTPTFTLTGLQAVQDSLIEWTYDNPTTWNSTTVWNAATTVVTTNATNTSNGVSIYVRAIITNNNYEGLSSRDISLAVDGMNSVGKWDVVNSTCALQTGADKADFAVQTLNPRPTITPVTTSTIATNTALIPDNSQN